MNLILFDQGQTLPILCLFSAWTKIIRKFTCRIFFKTRATKCISKFNQVIKERMEIKNAPNQNQHISFRDAHKRGIRPLFGAKNRPNCQHFSSALPSARESIDVRRVQGRIWRGVDVERVWSNTAMYVYPVHNWMTVTWLQTRPCKQRATVYGGKALSRQSW